MENLNSNATDSSEMEHGALTVNPQRRGRIRPHVKVFRGHCWQVRLLTGVDTHPGQKRHQLICHRCFDTDHILATCILYLKDHADEITATYELLPLVKTSEFYRRCIWKKRWLRTETISVTGPSPCLLPLAGSLRPPPTPNVAMPTRAAEGEE